MPMDYFDYHQRFHKSFGFSDSEKIDFTGNISVSSSQILPCIFGLFGRFFQMMPVYQFYIAIDVQELTDYDGMEEKQPVKF